MPTGDNQRREIGEGPSESKPEAEIEGQRDKAFRRRQGEKSSGSESEEVLEIGSQLITLSILSLIYIGTFFLYGRNAALVTLLILCSMPYFTLGSIFLHITQPFLIFWILSRSFN